jgi:triacylglycerol esterase/lipase EstA (alpha/beta hydrolase family)
MAALVAIASSAALQYQPSVQFLHLLLALDIAWVVAGTTLAVRALWGDTTAFAAGFMMSVISVLSIVLYLTDVGLGTNDGWLVDGT